LQEDTPDDTLGNIAFSYNILDQAAITMTVFDQIKFVRDCFNALTKCNGRPPNHPELAKALPPSGTMTHKWSDISVLRKILVVAQLEPDVSLAEEILSLHEH